MWIVGLPDRCVTCARKKERQRRKSHLATARTKQVSDRTRSGGMVSDSEISREFADWRRLQRKN